MSSYRGQSPRSQGFVLLVSGHAPRILRIAILEVFSPGFCMQTSHFSRSF